MRCVACAVHGRVVKAEIKGLCRRHHDELGGLEAAAGR